MAERGIARSRTAAGTLIKAGCVFVNGSAAEKPSLSVGENDKIEVRGAESVLKYVGRGGFKLERAIENFGITLDGRCCLDVGASTGGFTDCMLRYGARKVFAVDVGHGQLSEKLRGDPRVVSLEGLDIRSAGGEISEPADFIGIDVSFISLRLILPEIVRFAAENAECAALIKPQFECGRKRCKNGVVRDERVRGQVVEEITGFARELGFEEIGVIPSPITGGDGNAEFLMHFRLHGIPGMEKKCPKEKKNEGFDLQQS